MYYLYKDHLGSITAIADASGTVVERRSFDAWGRLRNPYDWSYNNIPAMTLLDRGYTGHEHLTLFGLINMNGRMYDPLLGQMLSPDPYVQDIAGSQGFNRYSYCLNNPLKYTDPSGENPLLLIGIAVGVAVNLAVNASKIHNGMDFYAYAFTGAFTGALGGIFGAGVGVAQGAMLGAASGFSAGFVAGAGNAWIAGEDVRTSLRKGLQGGLMGGAIGAVAGGISGGVRANKMGLNLWTGKGKGTLESAMPNLKSDKGGKLTGFDGSAQDITDYTFEHFKGSSEYNIELVSIGKRGLPDYTIKDMQLYNPEGRAIGGVTSYAKEKIFAPLQLRINISPSAAIYANDLRAVLGHEVIHAYHISTGMFLRMGKDWSEYFAYQYSSSFTSNWQDISKNMILYHSTRMSYFPFSNSYIYPSWVKY